MNPTSDETLTLYYYNDGLSAKERQAVTQALSNDLDVARRYRELCNELRGIEFPDVRAPADMIERWHDTLDRGAALEKQTSAALRVHSWSFLLGAAVTAAMVVGIGIGVLWQDSSEPAFDNPIASTVGVNEAAFLRSLRVHLQESRQRLVGFTGTHADQGELLLDIVQQNRLYERAAEQNDAEDLARVLRAFELVLLDLATGGVSDAERDLKRQKLLFELNVVLTKMSRQTSDQAETI